MESDAGKYCYSLNEEDFTGAYDSIEEAKGAGEEAAIEEEQDTYFVGQCREIVPYISAWRILDQLQEDAYEEVGEPSENYLDNVKDEQKDELEKVLNEVLHQWFEKYNLKLDFYGVDNVEEVKVT